MTNQVLLDENNHRDIKIDINRSRENGDDVGCTRVFPVEYKVVQNSYPIVFQKSKETDSFESLALLGLYNDENLFLREDGWKSDYIPLYAMRQPFMIGFSETDGSVDRSNPMVFIDMDSKRISHDKGEALFEEDGKPTKFIDHITSVLKTIHLGYQEVDSFSKSLEELELLEPFRLKLDLVAGPDEDLVGFHTINEDKLKSLNANELLLLHSKGYLELIYMVLASNANFKKIIDMKNNQLSKD